MIQTPPSSSTNNAINTIGVVGFFLALCACNVFALSGIPAVMLCMASYGGTILLLEAVFLRTPWRASVGLDFSSYRISPKRVVIKLIGIYGSIGFIAFLYWLFPEYHGNYYNTYWEFLGRILPTLLFLAVPYTAFMDGYLKEPHETYYRYGCFLLLDWAEINFCQIGQHLLGWLVKGFFLPLMLTSVSGNINFWASKDLLTLPQNFEEFFHGALSLIYTVDLIVAVSGYVLTIRLFDTHVRSTEPTLFGWWVCTLCYQPFQGALLRFYLQNEGNEDNWLVWLHDYPLLQTIWGTTALATIMIYVIASVNFGCRFSNLTHRGVLTNGMYRFTKHPAYVSKNLHWWLVYVPFLINRDLSETLRCCLMMAGTNLIYFLRARSEEKHLSHDPAYVAYALWMNDHSLFHWLGRIVPQLRYKAPADWEKYETPYQGIK